MKKIHPPIGLELVFDLTSWVLFEAWNSENFRQPYWTVYTVQWFDRLLLFRKTLMRSSKIYLKFTTYWTVIKVIIECPTLDLCMMRCIWTVRPGQTPWWGRPCRRGRHCSIRGPPRQRPSLRMRLAGGSGGRWESQLVRSALSHLKMAMHGQNGASRPGLCLCSG